METIRLRTLTLKSKLKIGRYPDLTVEQLIKSGNQSYLIWVYYKYEFINFLPEVLTELKIKETITKPGTNLLKAKQETRKYFKTDKFQKAVRKQKYIKYNEAKQEDRKKFTKRKLMSINHGHK